MRFHVDEIHFGRMKKSGSLVLQSNGMSSLAASFTSTQNDLERWKLSRELQQIECEEYYTRMNKGREIHKLKDLVLEYIATGCVYKQHRFERYDPFKKEESIKKREQKRLRHQKRSDSSSKSLTTKKTKEEIIPPKLDRSKTMVEHVLGEVRQPSRAGRVHQSLPDITRPIENVRIQDDLTSGGYVDDSVYNGMRKVGLSNHDNDDTKSKLSVSFLPTIKRVALWEQPQKDQKEEERRERIRHKRYQPNLKEEFQKMFPGNCKTSYSMKKFIDRETRNVIRDIDTVPRKLNRREQDHLIKKSQLPEFIDRHKSTSAILRDFRDIKRTLKTDSKDRKQVEENEKYNQILRFLELAESFEQCDEQ